MSKKNLDYEKVCLFCEFATPLRVNDNVLCKFKGVVSEDFVCRKFAYDPLKRRPMPRPDLPTLSKDDLL